MRELTIGGGKPLPEGIDTRELGLDSESFRKRQEEEYAAKLAYRREHWIGNFKTNLRCACKAYITDHATEHDPDAHVSLRDVRMGPGPSVRERVERFRVHHQYWCDACGLVYKASVIEGSRGWVPRERQPEFTGP